MRADAEKILSEISRIESDRIALRRFSQADKHDVLEYGSDRETVKYLVWDGIETLEQAEEAIREYYSVRAGIFAIEHKESKKCIGCIDLRLDAGNDKAGFGYVLNRAFWNRGYMSEALCALIGVCFGALTLNRVEAEHYAENPASGRVMLKCGMLYEGTGRKEQKVKGVFRDVLHYGMLLEDWTEAK